MLYAFNPEDAEPHAEVCCDADRTIGVQANTAQQVQAWVLYLHDIDEFRPRLLRGLTLVAEEKSVFRTLVSSNRMIT